MNGILAAAIRPARAAATSRDDGLWMGRTRLLADAWIELASRRHGFAAANQRVTVLRPVVVTGRA